MMDGRSWGRDNAEYKQDGKIVNKIEFEIRMASYKWYGIHEF